MKYDVVVVGGGPAGMMAAGRAAEAGAKVLLLEKNKTLGLKLLITGSERCNLTNQLDNRSFIEKFGPNGKFLFSGLSRFSPKETIDFFTERGVKIKIEDNNRAFPLSNKSSDVLQALIDYLHAGQVTIKFNSTVQKLSLKNKKIEHLILTSGEMITATNFIIATGGLAYPATGSSGDAYPWLTALGHTIVKPVPALVNIILTSKKINCLEGLSLKAAAFKVFVNDKKIASSLGAVIFTHDGLSGPAIFEISATIARALPEPVVLDIDLLPDMSAAALTEQFLLWSVEKKNKTLKNVLSLLLPASLAEFILADLNLKPQTKMAELLKADRVTLIQTIKAWRLAVKGTGGFDRAMLTSGGVALSEVDPLTMQSKLVNNLFLVGELLDLAGPTGGFNLQVCWTTGFVAGVSSYHSL